MLLKLPNNSLLPNTIYKTKMQKRKCKELNRDIEIQSQEDSMEEGNIWKILSKEKRKTKYQENPKPKICEKSPVKKRI